MTFNDGVSTATTWFGFGIDLYSLRLFNMAFEYDGFMFEISVLAKT